MLYASLACVFKLFFCSSHLECLRCHCGDRIIKESVETVEPKLCSNNSLITCCIMYYDEACSRKMLEKLKVLHCVIIFFTPEDKFLALRTLNSLK